ncbi:nicotinate phosphoribosyltransferase [Pseudogulbenkiania ferrooxidans]|uniref:Nicotinate phosphoribosyltransferase n=1 Tax=Pseudogulbenkiania ferrooxidans 2002 TaxID=279714 RepID=B9Z819_9NEIS|nr:nicotinate phosphoribosyltransferase [Pseudogulbenkiania ferrooxidans]EEG07074.1 nicotinate phosphoribosyltransferase [Pseudogulbenkiania ferrooxidans 2002]
MSDSSGSVLLTDWYQLTMLQAYFDEGMAETAVFECFVRSLPPGRDFLIAAGLEQLLQYVETLRFTPLELDWLAGQHRFKPAFLDYLRDFRFCGDIDAMPEGTLFYPNEPILRVTAPIAQAQLIESRLINLVHFQTVVASKAVRCALAAPGKRLVDFGFRRTHGGEAGLMAARACYLAGYDGTATVQAGMRFGIPVFGTMAHSYVEAHATEVEAFEHFARSQPDNVVLLIDTYDTEAAARKVAALAPRLAQQGIRIGSVRLDSGDLAAHARAVRAILDAAGQQGIGIFCSGNLDEDELRCLLAAGAPIDGFGVGTRVDTACDSPYLDCVYKLQEYAGTARRKRSTGKATWPGRKQVYRCYAADGRFDHDVVALLDEPPPAGEPLLQSCMRQGQRVGAAVTLAQSRDHVAAQLRRLPATRPYRVEISPALQDLAQQLDREEH